MRKGQGSVYDKWNITRFKNGRLVLVDFISKPKRKKREKRNRTTKYLNRLIKEKFMTVWISQYIFVITMPPF